LPVQANSLLLRAQSSGSRLATPDAPIPRIVHEALTTAGESIGTVGPPSLRTPFGRDFSHVRIHTGPRAAEAAAALGARAFTADSDVVFGEGQYKPATVAGATLLTHELVHVVQQGTPRQDPDSRLTLTSPDDPSEQAAEDGEFDGISHLGRHAVQRAPDTPGASAAEAKVAAVTVKVRGLLSKGMTKWSISSENVKDALAELKPLNDSEMTATLAQLERDGLVDRIFASVGATESKAEAPLIERIRRFRPARNLLLNIPSIPICEKPEKGDWEMARAFDDLDALVKDVETVAKDFKLRKLGILAHGDVGGVIHIGTTEINVANLDASRAKISTLAGFLTPDADVYVYGCVSAVGRAGSALLKELSSMLPGRRIIGFNVLTSTPMAGHFAAAEMCIWPDIQATDMKSDLFKDINKSRVPATESAAAAKIAKDGVIIKWPADERKERDDGTKESESHWFKKK
jgi:Domain of unknown function (DUF4157)/Domain of unknown function (DUF4347)